MKKRTPRKAKPAHNPVTPSFDEWLESQKERQALYATLDSNALTELLLQADYHVAQYKQLLDEMSPLLADMPAIVSARESRARHIGGLAATLSAWPAIERVNRSDKGLSAAREAAVVKRKTAAQRKKATITTLIDGFLKSGNRPGLAWSAEDAAAYVERQGRTLGYARSTIKKLFMARRKLVKREAAK